MKALILATALIMSASAAAANDYNFSLRPEDRTAKRNFEYFGQGSDRTPSQKSGDYERSYSPSAGGNMEEDATPRQPMKKGARSKQ